jgi:hypothetical protein
MKSNKWKLEEMVLTTKEVVKNPFWDVKVRAKFVHEDLEIKQEISGFYDGINESGEHVWKVRWTAGEEGVWRCEITSNPKLQGLNESFIIEVEPAQLNKKGFLRAHAKEPWGFVFDNEEPFFLFGDTIYNLFGAHYSGVNVEKILKHRRSQGINYIRARMQVSSYHPDVVNQWQIKDCWPWGGSSQWPDFTRLKLDYFKAVDEVVSIMNDLGMGLELIFEAWMLEFPFNDRGKFLPEHEELWFEYIIARYAAFQSVYIWNPSNEYEFYPGEVMYHPEADRWIKRLAGIIKTNDPFKHPVGVHNYAQHIPLCKRIGDIEDIDAYLVQSNWGLELGEHDGDLSLCKWLEKQVHYHSPNKDKAVLCSEFGYERVEGCYTTGAFERMDHHHTRRGQYRAGFSGYPVVHGFNNTWGAHMRVDVDAKGAEYLLPYYKFMTEDINFFEMRPASEVFVNVSGSEEAGTLPLCLAKDDKSVIAIYFPASGHCTLQLKERASYEYYWFNPRSGSKTEVKECNSNYLSTEYIEKMDKGDGLLGNDWVIVLLIKE